MVEPTITSELTAPWARPLTILLVDDQPIIGESVRLTLEGETDLLFHYCSDGTRALEVARELDPSVVLVDLVMPDVDGLDLVARLREDETTRHVPLIVLSTREDPAVKAEAFKRGANDYLVKLPSALELVARIRYHAEAHRNAARSRHAYAALKESQEQLRQRNDEIRRQRDVLASQARELEVRNEFIKKTFGRYISEEVVESLLHSPDGLRLGGESRNVTIMMSDLRGFTSLADALTPEQVVRMLNNYLGAMAEVISEHRGTIDEFIGDAILALFGAPVAASDDARRAVACAIAMQQAMAGVNARNAAEGLPRLEMGIALHTGLVVVGNIGSDKRTKYGAVGSPVNLTSRIESCTVGGQVLLSADTFAAAGPDVETGQTITLTAKGFAGTISVHELRGLRGAGKACLPQPSERMVALREAVPVRFDTLQGKQLEGRERLGSLTWLSRHRAVMSTPELPAVLSNIRLHLVRQDGSDMPWEIYAKVVSPEPDQPHEGAMIHFTSTPQDAMDLLGRHLASSGVS